MGGQSQAAQAEQTKQEAKQEVKNSLKLTLLTSPEPMV
jgi:hypothetical protein